MIMLIFLFKLIIILFVCKELKEFLKKTVFKELKLPLV